MKYVIFLDVDGVLTSNRSQFALNPQQVGLWSRFDPLAVEFLNKVCDTYQDVSIVLTSTWRTEFPYESGYEKWIPLWAEAAFRSCGFRGKFAEDWRTVNIDNYAHKKRAYEVVKWLQNHQEVQDYIIIDDDDSGFNSVLPKKRFVKTDPDNGMLFKHMLKANSIIGNWEKRYT